MKDMKEYYFDRTDFTEIFSDVFGISNYLYIFHDIAYTIDVKIVGGFSVIHDRESDKWYFTHLKSGTIISWRGLHQIGRDNSCNKPGFTHEDLKEFFTLLKIAIDTELSW